MARGWESKAIESQIEEAQSSQQAKAKSRVDTAELERRRTREGLELARKRVLHDLETCRNSRYEQILRAALKDLDTKIEKLK